MKISEKTIFTSRGNKIFIRECKPKNLQEKNPDDKFINRFLVVLAPQIDQNRQKVDAKID